MNVLRAVHYALGAYLKARSFKIPQVRADSGGQLRVSSVSRLTGDWPTSTASADSQARMSLVAARARCRDLRDDNDTGAKFVGMVKTNVLGEAGIHFRSGVKEADRVINNELIPGKPDVFANKMIEDGWYKWGRKQFCTVQGDLTWCDVQRVVVESLPSDGEHLIEKVKVASNPFGFALRLMESDYLDEQYNGTYQGNEIRMGVEMDKDHKRVAYWLWRNNPNDSFFFRSNRSDRRRVPAEDIIHLGLIRRAEQTRFTPWMATAAPKLKMVGEYEYAEHVGKRIEASKVGFWVQDGTGPSEFTGEKDDAGNFITDVQSGSMQIAPKGYKPIAIDWQRPASNYAEFVKASLRQVASGLQVSYNDLANDMESVNFASGKLGLMYQREIFKALQAWFIESFCEEVFGSWLQMALSTGVLGTLPYSKFEKFNAPVFRGRRWAPIDREKEVAADIRQLNSALTSHSRICAEQNIDFHELLDEIKADREAMEARDIEAPELESELASMPPANTVDASGSVQTMEEQ